MTANPKDQRTETHFQNLAGSVVGYPGHPALFVKDPVSGQMAMDTTNNRFYVYTGSTNGWRYMQALTTSTSSSSSSSSSTSSSTSTSTSTSSSSTSTSSTTTMP